MNHRKSVDHHAVLRARVLLLGSGTINIHETVDAYRVLANVSPAVYLPRLAQALLEYDKVTPRNAETRLAVVTEATEAARRMDETDKKRAALLLEALEALREELLLLGRTEEARSVGQEHARPAAEGKRPN
ncbi:hypothetical protein AB0D35_27275 [Streptomyces sp. NPDC048301]|uniref:hypothetical protein n=1 Tax=unclassified Streptomyces TaxID=2593676 RepID=UPI003420E80C